ncbi:MAG: WD40/YVTN/BNR-like repeat-containing protein [Gammaproteobacteria bacterium]
MTSSKHYPHNVTGLILLIGTQKGLFLARATLERRAWTLDGPFIPGYEIPHAWLDPREPQAGYAAANHPVWGSHVYRTQSYGKSWESMGRAPHHDPELYTQRLRALWHLAPGSASEPDVLYAGIDPPGLFVSRDAGAHWSPIIGLNHHPTRNTWEPARGGFAVHSVQVDPHDPNRIYAAVSAGGAFRSDDKGRTWKPINRGVRAENLPLNRPEAGHNIHRLLLHPARSARLYRQCYNGTYRSDDRGENWTEITAGLPSDFGYGIAVDPGDPNTVFVIPEQSSHMRAVVDGRLRIFRSSTAGQHWEALLDGLPQQHAYVTVLREALATDGLDPCGVYFGTSGGHLFASRDRGEHWEVVAAFLPRILSIKAAVV